MSPPVYAGKGRRITLPSSFGLTPSGKRTVVTDDPKTAVMLPDTPHAQRFRRRLLQCGDLVELALDAPTQSMNEECASSTDKENTLSVTRREPGFDIRKERAPSADKKNA